MNDLVHEFLVTFIPLFVAIDVMLIRRGLELTPQEGQSGFRLSS